MNSDAMMQIWRELMPLQAESTITLPFARSMMFPCCDALMPVACNADTVALVTKVRNFSHAARFRSFG